MAVSHPNPKDSMKSTWRQKERSQWNLAQRALDVLNIHPQNLNQEVPVHPKTDKVPLLTDWSMHRWVIFHAAIPIVLHHLFAVYTGRNLTTFQAFLIYTTAFKLNGIREIHILRDLGHKFGFLDGDQHERDGVPDVGAWKIFKSLMSTSTVRPVFTVFIAYRANETPANIHWWWLPLEAGLYGIILDFFFYWYHRLMHEISGLWQFHRTHHLTKHPNPLLTLYADTEQEFFDIAGIPLITYFTMRLMGMPMGFYEWWVCHEYVVFAELAGHSGIRLLVSPPNTLTPILRLFKAEIIIEDHDLHHRKGWKSSGNYGKQTRLWDRIFGTCKDRIECDLPNVDFATQVALPIL